MDELLQLIYMAYTLIVIGIFVVILLIAGIKAEYGRFNKGTGLLPPKLHWFIQESPCIIIGFYLVCYGQNPRQYHWRNYLVIFVFFVHYFQRALIYPFLIRNGKPSRLLEFVCAVIYCSYNSYLQIRFHTSYADYTNISDGENVIQSVVGVSTFLTGFLLNVHSDYILRNLRKPGETGYKIPRRGLFEYISCANYFSEIVEWFGFAILGQSIPAWTFLFFTICNLGPRALQYHRFYQEKFEDYPKSRKAIIPFVI